VERVPIWVCRVEEPIIWEAIFLHEPTVLEIREAIRWSIAKESEETQVNPRKLEKQIYGLASTEIIGAVHDYMAELVSLVKQDQFELIESEAWK